MSKKDTITRVRMLLNEKNGEHVPTSLILKLLSQGNSAERVVEIINKYKEGPSFA